MKSNFEIKNIIKKIATFGNLPFDYIEQTQGLLALLNNHICFEQYGTIPIDVEIENKSLDDKLRSTTIVPHFKLYKPFTVNSEGYDGNPAKKICCSIDCEQAQLWINENYYYIRYDP